MQRTQLILDADTISYILKGDSEVVEKFNDFTTKYNPDYHLCPMVYYQVKRGLIDKKAARQLQNFEEISSKMLWIDYERDDWERAITLWLLIKKKGFSPKHQDADILIAAQAERINAKVITHNLKDFIRLGVECDTWKE